MVAQLPNPQATYDWWKVYGPFDAGEGMMPHIGHMIRWYREQQGWKIEDLAGALGISKPQAYALEESITMPKDISRRQALIELLGIPPLLLAVPFLELVPVQSAGKLRVLDPQSFGRFEGILSLSWDTYYGASAQSATGLVEQCIAELDGALAAASGIERDQLYGLKVRFLQLGGVIARDRLDFESSLETSGSAITLARHLGNPELIASALFRRARTHLQMDNQTLAARDLEEALPFARRSRDALRCYVFICWAEVQSQIAPTDRQVQRAALAALDDVARTVRSAKSVLDGDGSFTRVDLPGLFMERTNVLRRFGMIDAAHDTLAIVRENLGPALTRWQGNLRIADAQLCLASGDIDGGCFVASEGLKIVRATRSKSNERKIDTVFRQLYAAQPHHSRVRNLGRELGYPL